MEPLLWLRKLIRRSSPHNLPTLSLGKFPTPLEKIKGIAGADLWVKRDDLSGAPYGGNKIRKLELLMAAALARNSKSVITFGAAGSNHALATALVARQVGLRCVNILGPQVNSIAVRRNLLASFQAGAELVYSAWRDTPVTTAWHFARLWREDGVPPSVIPPGGSSPLGALGFVNAALELAEQWQHQEETAPPDAIYVASGTMATCVGIATGLALAGWPTRVEAVRVTVAPFTSMCRAKNMYAGIQALLREYGISLPALDGNRFRLREDFFGGEYARHTPESAAAVQYAWEHWGLRLEGTYTGKALAACLHDLRTGEMSGNRIVFWNTYNSNPAVFEPLTREHEPTLWRQLPEPFHRYFEEDVQELDAVM